jgi:hypothetical protein
VADTPEPATETATTETATTEIAAAPAAPVDVAPEPTATRADNDNSLLFGAAIFAALAALALAIWGFIAIGRRKPVAKRTAPMVERPTIHHPAPIHAEPEPAPRATVTPMATMAPASSLAHTGASVALPRTLPASFEERNALINRMVAAKPDRANPFTSPIQRRKRAKLILQSLGRDFGNQEPWIDLSQYPQNWPELARRSQAA